MKRSIAGIVGSAAFALAGSALAVSHQTALAGYTDGEVRKVDKAAGKVTLKHGPIANLEMPPMTMVFRVRDPKMLDNVKAGDKVKFKADKVQGSYTVIELAPAGK
jgi:Cu/Ag efflux protein CusF